MNYMTEANAIANQLRPERVRATREHKGATEKQMEILAFMREFFGENDQLPPISVSAERFEMNVNSMNWHVQQLLKFRLLERNVVGKLRFARAKGGER